jgi:hypothetical protein
LDTETGELAALFHPRRDQWHEHFLLKGEELVGLTPPARATIRLLRLTHPHGVQERLVRFGCRWTPRQRLNKAAYTEANDRRDRYAN